MTTTASPHGWIGMAAEVHTLLFEKGADHDGEGHYYVYYEGYPPVSFLGMGEEVVFRGTEEYSVGGKRFNLVSALLAADIGVGVGMVI